jgi:regulator of cell morphogenesis and NO signaling
METEERDVFPILGQLDEDAYAGLSDSLPHEKLLTEMEDEHEEAGRDLAAMRNLTGDFATPADGCASYRALMESLLRLEGDMHIHVHKENSILFPRAARQFQTAASA